MATKQLRHYGPRLQEGPVKTWPHPVAFQVPHSNFEVVVLRCGEKGPSGVVLDPRSTDHPTRWDASWDATRRGMRGSGLSLVVRKSVSLLAEGTAARCPEGKRVMFNLRSASYLFVLELELAEKTSVRTYLASSRWKKRRRAILLPDKPFLLATSTPVPGGRSVERFPTREYSRVRSIPLERAVDLLLSARPVGEREASALSR